MRKLFKNEFNYIDLLTFMIAANVVDRHPLGAVIAIVVGFVISVLGQVYFGK